MRRIILGTGLLLGLYALAAYWLLPSLWTHYDHQRGLAGSPMVTRTAEDFAGDPLNVGLVGSKEDIVAAMHEAGWFPADPVTLRTSLEIIGSVVLDRPYETAPVSPLYYLGRRENLAFEQPAGSSADRRQHVRIWQVLAEGEEGRPVWLGASSFDAGVGFSHYTGAVTHRIAPDIDAARDALADDLEAAGMVTTTYETSGVGPTLMGRNGEGDPYRTDGEVRFLVLTGKGERRSEPPDVLGNPPLIDLKNALWRGMTDALSP